MVLPHAGRSSHHDERGDPGTACLGSYQQGSGHEPCARDAVARTSLPLAVQTCSAAFLEPGMSARTTRRTIVSQNKLRVRALCGDDFDARGEPRRVLLRRARYERAIRSWV